MMDGRMESLVSAAADAAGVALVGDRKKDLASYLDLLEKWNTKINLVSRKGFSQAVADRMFDALILWREFRPWSGKSHLDVGSGGGFPAIPIHIMSPAERLTLMEPRHKRAGFLSTVAAELQLRDIEVRCERLDRQTECAGQLDMSDVITAQAVKPFHEMALVILARLAVNGEFVWTASNPMSEADQRAVDGCEGKFRIVQRAAGRPDGGTCRIGSIERCL